MKTWVKAVIIIFAILIVLIIAGSIAFNKINSNLENLVLIQIDDVDLGTVEDGLYMGSYSVFPVSVDVEVEVSNHVITSILITKHDNGQGTPAEVIIDDVILAQSIDVDSISGATYSSKVKLLAIKDALSNIG
ncbi:MAG: FMN-binding protein [Candidatus Izemoplasmatales bacterium]|nr:FMN-binding protein [Candidatus Izemoplasmatales bacterium]